MECGRSGLIKINQNTATVYCFKCKSWKCETCAPKLKRRLVAIAREGAPNKLLTLTVRPSAFANPDEAARALVSAWRRARQQLKKYHGHKDIQFLAVFEQHRSGWPHLHILLRSAFISQKWLSAYMGRRIDSPIVDIRKIRGKRHAAQYVSKYIAKRPERYAGAKRWWRSLAYVARRLKAPRDPAIIWQVTRDAAAWLDYYMPDLAAAFRTEGQTKPFRLVWPLVQPPP